MVSRSQKRERLELIFDVLLIIKKNNNSIKPTPLMRASNLSSTSFNLYEKILLGKKFVRIELDSNNRKYYTLTDKGFNYLDKYDVIKKFISEFDL